MWDSSSSTDLPDFEDFEGEPKLLSYTRRSSADCSSVLMGRQRRIFEHTVAKSIVGPGISLTVSGDSRISNELPSFMEGDKVAGGVRVSVNKADDIRAVHVSLKGRVMTGRNSDAVCTFLDLRKTLWIAESSDLEAHRDPKNEGDYAWSYSLVLPKEVVISQVDGIKKQVFALPHTFTEPNVPARVQYELVAFLKQSPWKRNRRIAIEIGCFQSNKSHLRPGNFLSVTSSCAEGGSDVTSGWKALNFDAAGIISQQTVKFRGLLYLKEPLCYTRGSYIPLLLKLSCQDKQALEFISSPDAVVVHLTRRVNYKDVQMCGGKPSRWSSVMESVGVATWKVHEEILSGVHVRPEWYCTLIGQVELKRDLVPSSLVANLAIEYSISVRPFSSLTFQPKYNKSELLLSQTVEITTDLSSSI